MILIFGVNVSTSATENANPVEDAIRAERLGFDFVSSSDHPAGSTPTFETWTMLSWIAARTSKIRIATRVLGVPYRSPAMVAKMAETFDRLSGGRLILGLGGGYSDEEFRAFGLGTYSPRDKIDGLEEAIQICRGLWSRADFTFDGRLYRTEKADLNPKPDHKIPIWVGTFGPRALNVTGRHADGWIPSLSYAPPNRIKEMRERIISKARASHRNPEEITFCYNIDINIEEHVRKEPDVVSGTPDAVSEKLFEFARLGFNAMNFMPVGPNKIEQVGILAKEIIPTLRESLQP